MLHCESDIIIGGKPPISNFNPPYYYKQGEYRLMVKCRYCQFSYLRNTIRKCLISHKKCERNFIFCDHYRVAGEVRVRMNKSAHIHPKRGGWLEDIEPFHSIGGR